MPDQVMPARLYAKPKPPIGGRQPMACEKDDIYWVGDAESTCFHCGQPGTPVEALIVPASGTGPRHS